MGVREVKEGWSKMERVGRLGEGAGMKDGISVGWWEKIGRRFE